MNWSPEQLQAIEEEGKNIIVSAGAGSGKTAVLTARVQRKLLSGIHINRLLVLTFTNAAAAEMKERIRKTIHKTKGLEEEANLIDGAYITTFDAFSLALVKKYHTKLNITNNITISDEVVIDIKKNELLDEIFEKNYLTPKKNFTKLINDFCLKDYKELKKYILNLYKKIELKYNKEDYLNNYFDNLPSIDEIINNYLNIIKEKQSIMNNLLKELINYFDEDFILKIKNNFNKLLSAKTYSEFIESLDYESIRLPRGIDPSGKKIKQAIYDTAKEIEDLCIFASTEEMKKDILSTKENTEVILNILKEFDKSLEEYKNKNSIYNFTDISRLAIKVVKENKEVRDELKYQFKEILIDEYQDTSDIQEMFISLISNNNVYMVGDIKQSIYRFRNANPYIFKNKYDSYRDNTTIGLKIDLLKNFRSRDEVLNSINLLFDKFMDDKLGGADYKDSHRMIFGNKSYLKEGKTSQNYDLEVITYNDKELGKITKDEEEAFIIGNDILSKINSNYQVYDKDTNSLRNIEYKDFVILLDKSKNFDLYKKIFEYLNIPLTILKDESLKKDEDILVIRNLLRLLICIKENRYDTEFKYVFTSISRSFLYKTSDKEIYNYFINNSFKDSSLYKKAKELLKDIDNTPISIYIDNILNAFNYEEKLLTIGRVKNYRIRREYIYNLCKNYEELGNNIYDFISYLNQIFEGDYDLKFNISTIDTNSCRIMTIHKSKGLEFPICYFAGFSSKFNISELKERIIFDNYYGIVLPYVNEYYKDTIIKTIIKNNIKREEISEKIRLLYVALTRAREKMIMVIPEVEEDTEVLDIVPLYEREKYSSFLSIIKSITSILLPYINKTEIYGTKDYLNNNKSNNNDLLLKKDELKVDEITIKKDLIEDAHYSKDTLHITTKEEKELMEFGTKVHEILERIDFNDYNLNDYNIDDKIKNKITAFINSDLMKNRLNNKMYKEYEFIYNDNNTISHGIIDLLIEDNDNMIIIDYKLNNIDDDNYDKQLNGYRNYIERITNKKVKCYLYSIIKENYREVYND